MAEIFLHQRTFPVSPELTIPVSVYSSHPWPIWLQLNRGDWVAIPGVGADWVPVSPPAGSFGVDNGGPSANNFGPGLPGNEMQIQVGEAFVYLATMVMTNDDPTSVQLYLFADLTDASAAHWLLLTDGAVNDSDLMGSSSP
jgi:hypothetical protein